MKLKNKFRFTILTLITISFLFACKRNDINKDTAFAKNKIIDKQRLMTIDTFSTFPPEIDGCSCYFSSDSIEFKKEKYIYMNDLAETSFMKINDTFTKFTQTDFKQIDSLNIRAKYKSEKFIMIIESKQGPQSGDETSLMTGKITLTNKQGKTITKTFYGECGC